MKTASASGKSKGTTPLVEKSVRRGSAPKATFNIVLRPRYTPVITAAAPAREAVWSTFEYEGDER